MAFLLGAFPLKLQWISLHRAGDAISVLLHIDYL
jgi:hypothetical protein